MLGTFKTMSQAKRVVIDIETRDPHLQTKGPSWVYKSGHIVGIGTKIDNEESEYYPIGHQTGNYDKDKVYNYLKSIPNTATVVGHYLQYDLGWLLHESGWLHRGSVRCSLVSSQLRNNILPSYSLDNLCRGFQLGEKSDIGDPTLIWQKPVSSVALYCCKDIDLTAKLDDYNWQVNETPACIRENKIVKIVVLMKAQGVKIDFPALASIQQSLKDKFDTTMKQCPDITDIWANAAVATLFRRLGLKTIIGGKRQLPSFPNWYLESINHPQIQALAKARKLDRLINGFVPAIRMHTTGEDRMHPDFFNGKSGDGGTVTGRLSSANVNVQQIPHRTEEGALIRSCFISSNGVWAKFDYSQQEPRIMLNYASKLNLKRIDEWRNRYLSNPRADFYEPIQQIMSVDRNTAKTTTLARCYGMGADKLARLSHCNVDMAMEYLYKFDKGVPWLAELKEVCKSKATTAKRIRTLGDRYLYFDRTNTEKSFNHLIQGSAADQIKEAMIRIYEDTGLVPMLQVHDELDYDLTEQQYLDDVDDRIELHMIQAFSLDLPTVVDVSIGNNWMECE